MCVSVHIELIIYVDIQYYTILYIRRYYSAIQIHRYVCIEYHWIHTVMPSDKSQWLLLSTDDKWRWCWACNYQNKPSSVKHMSPYESRTHRFLVCLHRKMGRSVTPSLAHVSSCSYLAAGSVRAPWPAAICISGLRSSSPSNGGFQKWGISNSYIDGL